MTKDDFAAHLKRAAALAVLGPKLTRSAGRAVTTVPEFTDVSLPIRYFVVAAGGSKRLNHHLPFPVPDASIPTTQVGGRQYWGPLDSEGVLAVLWKDGFVPHWIDVCRPVASPESITMVLLASVSWTSSDDELLYRPDDGMGQSPLLGSPPFQVTTMPSPLQ